MSGESAPLPAVAPAGTRSFDFQSRMFAVVVLLLLVAPHVAFPFFLMKVLCFALFACAFNLLLGYGGLLSFGHAAYFGAASYVSAHATKVWGLTPELGILLGTGTACLLSCVFGAIAIRREGIYFAMITLALGQLVYFMAVQNADFTGGEDGIQAVPRGKLFGLLDLSDDRVLYYVVATIFFSCFFLIHRTIHSPFGQVLKAIRDNEPRAISLGYRTHRYKLVAFILSATLAGVAGATKAIVVQLASLSDVHWSMSGDVVLMTLVGGMGTITGPIVGAAVLVSMGSQLSMIGSWLTVVQGSTFIVCVLMFRDGVMGVLGRWLKQPL